MKKSKYHYDEGSGVLIRYRTDHKLFVLEKRTLSWRPFDYEKDDSYGRAIFLGQGCWEDLEIIDEKEALKIIEEWGAPLE